MNLSSLGIDMDKPQPQEMLVVRITTEYYRDKSNNPNFRRKIKLMKKMSTQGIISHIDYDIENSSVESFINSIVNFRDVDDGLYELKVINETHDFETGIIDGWDWKLFKIKVDM